MQHCGVIADAQEPYDQRVAQVRANGLAIWDLYAAVRRQGSGDEMIREPIANPIEALYKERGPIPILLNGRRLRECRRAFPDLKAELIALPSTSPRPLHWNTAESRAAAIEEWLAALGREF